MQYFIIYKPYGVLSQFTREEPHHKVLGDLYEFPKAVYPIGRLDKDSEGLLLISDDKELNFNLLNPRNKHRRSYWVQVEGAINEEAIKQLEKGVKIRIKKKKYLTKPTQALLIPPPPLPERDPPVRFRKSVPTSWLLLSLHEGKNRQVRRMCAAVGFPVLRLVRVSIENLELKEMKPGEVRELSGEKVKRMLFPKGY